MDELSRRLQRLAPEVDATFIPRGRSTRPRALIAAAIAACLVVVVGTVVLFWRGGHDPQHVATVTATTAVSVTPSHVTVTKEDLEMRISVADSTPALGTRIHVTTTVRNIGVGAVHYSHGDCDLPTHTRLLGPPPNISPTSWDGRSSLRSWLPAGSTSRSGVELPVPALLGTRNTSCTAAERVGTIEPGGSLVEDGLIDVRVGPGGPLVEGPLTLTAELSGWDSTLPPSSDGLTGRRRVSATLAVEPRDPDHHLDSIDAAITAFSADPRLQPWLDAETAALPPGPPPFGFQTELTWWAGTWELWVTPPNPGTQRALRMRYDPASGTVVDVRVVATFLAAADDPDADHTTQSMAPDTTIPAN